MHHFKYATLAVAMVLSGCIDLKDSGLDEGDSGGSDEPVRSIDMGGCPDSGSFGSALPLSTVLVEAGSFIMGNDADPDVAPAHNVTLTSGILMSVTEITQGQWVELGFDNPSQHDTCVDCPVEQVTWHEAAAYADALSAADGLAGCYTCTGMGADTSCTAPDNPYACAGWRLPTAAEWEHAAGVDSTLWAGSDDFAAVAWTAEAVGKPCPVGTLSPTSSGLYDLSGNVSEWVNDGYGDYTADDVVDPVAEDNTTRVVRGGSIFQVAGQAEITAREGRAGTEAVPWRGFRLVRPQD